MVDLSLLAAPTSFVGRSQELSELTGLLNTPECRLLTLVGQGGIGKTRLAQEVGFLVGQAADAEISSEAAYVFKPAGIYMVPLQPINSADLIQSVIAEAIGLQFYAGGDPRQQLIDYLRPKTVLLILDNFEHLLDGVEIVTDLLINVPQLKILVTSRESLNLHEEWLYPVRGMDVPDLQSGINAESYSAVQLFVQSARRVDSNFSLAAEQQSVMRICQLVEGMPLALEITAAWLRRLPAHEIVHELERGLDFLESPLRNVPSRHRSIRAVFEHSWNLLSEAEQNVFMKLSVFRGGFLREAAESAAGATLGSLSALVDKSLLMFDPAGRYTFHELVRQYAEEKLTASPAIAQETYESHSTYYMRFLMRRMMDMLVHMSPIVIAEITTELENVRVALNWVLDHGSVIPYKSALYCLTQFYQFRCLYEEGEAISAKIVENLRRSPPGETLARMLNTYGWFVELHTQDYSRAIALMEEGWSMARELHYKNSMEALLRLSDVAAQMGNYEHARNLAKQDIELVRTEDESWTHTFDYAQLGYVTYLLGDYHEAKQLIENASRIAEKYDVPTGLSDAQNILGRIEMALASHDVAKQIFLENLAYSKQNPYLKGIVLALIGVAEACIHLGEIVEARRYLSEALKTALDSNQIPYVLDALTITATLLIQTSHQEQAAEVIAFVLQHRAATHQTKRCANELWSGLETQMSAERASAAAEQAKSAQIENIVQVLIADYLNETLSNSGSVPSPLTEREIEILSLAANGLSNRDIADELFLAVGTVKWYLSEIYTKLYVTSRTQAIAKARELRLLS